MFDFHTLAEFSRTHCVAICAFLVPANLVATILTMILAALRRPPIQVWQAAGFALIFALIMVLHVFTWWAIGVVMAPTYILLWLGSTCLIANIGAVIYKGYAFNPVYERPGLKASGRIYPASLLD